MNLKDVVNNDILSVFLNNFEFADEHKIGNKTTICVIDEEKFQNKQKKLNSLEDSGIFEEGFTLFVEESFFKYLPHVGEILSVDDIEYEVIDCKKDMRMVEIDLMRYNER